MEYKRLTEKDWHKEKFYPKADNERVIRKRLWDLENKIEQGTLKEVKTCVWEEWQDGDFGSVWCCSNCKEDFCFIEGGVPENNYGYCPHCGAKIIGLKELQE